MKGKGGGFRKKASAPFGCEPDEVSDGGRIRKVATKLPPRWNVICLKGMTPLRKTPEGVKRRDARKAARGA